MADVRMNPSPALPGPLDPAVVRRAAEWMARLWSSEASDQDRAACEHWRAQHPDHERAWNRLQSFEDKLHALPREAARHALREPVRTGRRRALQLLGLTAAVGGIAAALRGTETWQLAASDHSTRTGEIREIALPDGTRVVLGTATAIDLRFDAHERRLVLRAGEILVTTAPDPAGAHRPFRVHSRQGSVEALGTRFIVRQEAEASRVAVFEGAVAVRPARAPEAMVRVGAGQGTVFFADRAQAPDAVADSAAAWTRGVLVAEDMRVADFVAELARYRPGVLRCDPEVAELRVTGVFSLRDTDRALENLALALPVSAAYRTRYWVTVRAR
ncbi:FecR domain-containing protein [Variovorax sp.]|jgi:transmembrane sensor|uniref:FecR domain-containing protein n=1 Tax=Variovorax sp. TaxID=1871043 RepID=UPI0025D43E67|nr:FecR domain-containing protein [Variovorax sp.]